MGSFESGAGAGHGHPLPSYDSVHSDPLYLLNRDEDCENAFHSTADFVSSAAIAVAAPYCCCSS